MSPATSHDRYHHRRPIDDRFYSAVREHLQPPAGVDSRELQVEGAVVDLNAGDLVEFRLEAKPQVVLAQAWSRDEPRERIWTNESSSVENAFLRPLSRLWSTMPWFRALLTMVEDDIQPEPAATEPAGHHFVLDGWETPAAWRADGGDPTVVTPWEHFGRLLESRGLDRSLHRDHIALFRKVTIDPVKQTLSFPTSDARVGDRVVLYTEMDLCLALVPSPYRAGGHVASELDGTVAPVRITTWRSGMMPLGWPYPDVPYPDIGPYVESLDRLAP